MSGVGEEETGMEIDGTEVAAALSDEESEQEDLSIKEL